MLLFHYFASRRVVVVIIIPIISYHISSYHIKYSIVDNELLTKLYVQMVTEGFQGGLQFDNISEITYVSMSRRVVVKNYFKVLCI